MSITPRSRRAGAWRFLRGKAWPMVVLALGLAVGCATGLSGEGEAFYAGQGSARLDPSMARDAARHAALAKAELQARDQIRQKALHMRLADGRVLGDVVAADAFARAVFLDAVAGAPIRERNVADDGTSIVVKMELAPIRKMIQNHPEHFNR